MTKELEWDLEKNESGLFIGNIRHIPCDDITHDLEFGTNHRMWCCGTCDKKAPNHVILQWKILTGK